MNRTDYTERLLELLNRGDYRQLRAELIELNEVDIALFIEEVPEDRALAVFRMLPKDMGAEVFSHLSGDAQSELARAFSDKDINEMLELLFIDDAVDFLEEMPANVVKRVLQQTEPERRSLINHYLQYPEDSAGSIMTAEFIDLKQRTTVGEAIHRLRTKGQDRETIYTCYVTNQSRVLEGVISVKNLLLAKDEEKVGDLMEDDIISVHTASDQEEVARLFSKYDLLSMPVVDNEGRLVGIVTIDDVIDVIEEEATEDFEKMAAMSPSEKPYLKTSVFEHSRKRVLWLLILMVSGMLNGYIIESYEQALVTIPTLITFMPMLMDTGGNAGSQSSTMIIRGMALHEIRLKDSLKVLWKELGISLIVGAIIAVVNLGRIYYFTDAGFAVAAVVSFSLLVTIMMAKVIGGLLPILAKALHLDPAIMAAPLITTLVDAGALFIYFHIATLVL